MIFLSEDLYLSAFTGEGYTSDDIAWFSAINSFGGEVNNNNPRIGYDNKIDTLSISADYENLAKPAITLANPSTAEAWQTTSTASQAIIFSTAGGAVDYIGLAGHNLGSCGCSYKLQTRADIVNYHEVRLSGSPLVTDIAIPAIDGDFEFMLALNGAAPTLISVTYASATDVTYQTLIDDINAELSGATISLTDGNLRITSDLGAPVGSVRISSVSGVNHFLQYVNNYVGMGNAAGWIDVTADALPLNDRAIMHQFDPIDNTSWRIVLTPDAGNATLPSIAVLYAGRALTLPRRIYVGHTPINYGRATTVSNARSQNGKFLGRTIRSEFLKSSFSMSNIPPEFYRSWIDPFVESARGLPFFFAWRPEDYPDEAAYCWTMGDINPQNEKANGWMQFSVDLEAAAP